MMAAPMSRVLGKQLRKAGCNTQVFAPFKNVSFTPSTRRLETFCDSEATKGFRTYWLHGCPSPAASICRITPIRAYSKSKEKGGRKFKGPVQVNENEIAELVKVDHLKDDLQKALDHLKADYVKYLTIRSTTGAIESLPVEFEGETYTLQEIAQLGRKGPQVLVVNVSSFPQAIKNILKSISDSGMGLNPQQDGTTIFIPIPKVTREYRESLAKNAKVLFQKFKDHNRDIQNRYVREVKKKDKEFSADLIFSVQQQIHAMAEQFASEGEKIMIAKQHELLGTKE